MAESENVLKTSESVLPTSLWEGRFSYTILTVRDMEEKTIEQIINEILEEAGLDE